MLIIEMKTEFAGLKRQEEVEGALPLQELKKNGWRKVKKGK